MPRSSAYLCRRCIYEDNGFWHMSYWRRAHQLPGVHACGKHPDQLLLAVVEENPFAFEPDYWLKRGLVAAHPAAEVMRSDPMVQRFVEICGAMLEGGRSWDFNLAQFPARARAEALGIGATISSGLTLLSDAALDRMPPPFLAEAFTSRAWQTPVKVAGKPFVPIDTAISHRSATAQGVALAMTLLYDSSEEALTAWRSVGVLVQVPAEVGEPVAA